MSQNGWCALDSTGHVALRPRQTGASATPSERGIASAKMSMGETQIQYKYTFIYNFHHILRSRDSRQKTLYGLETWRLKISDLHNKQAESCLAKNIMTNNGEIRNTFCIHIQSR